MCVKIAKVLTDFAFTHWLCIYSTPVLVVEVSRPFPYESQKAMPWDYNCNYTYQIAATDFSGVGGITRSGRCYASDMTEKVAPEKLLMPTREEQPSKEKEQPS